MKVVVGVEDRFPGDRLGVRLGTDGLVLVLWQGRL